MQKVRKFLEDSSVKVAEAFFYVLHRVLMAGVWVHDILFPKPVRLNIGNLSSPTLIEDIVFCEPGEYIVPFDKGDVISIDTDGSGSIFCMVMSTPQARLVKPYILRETDRSEWELQWEVKVLLSEGRISTHVFSQNMIERTVKVQSKWVSNVR